MGLELTTDWQLPTTSQTCDPLRQPHPPPHTSVKKTVHTNTHIFTLYFHEFFSLWLYTDTAMCIEVSQYTAHHSKTKLPISKNILPEFVLIPAKKSVNILFSYGIELSC